MLSSNNINIISNDNTSLLKFCQSKFTSLIAQDVSLETFLDGRLVFSPCLIVYITLFIHVMPWVRLIFFLIYKKNIQTLLIFSSKNKFKLYGD